MASSTTSPLQKQHPAANASSPEALSPQRSSSSSSSTAQHLKKTPTADSAGESESSPHPDSLPHAPLPGEEEDDSDDDTGAITVRATPAPSTAPMPRSQRYAHYDSDAHRLPEGFVRIAYDADRRVYTYRDSKGALWEGLPGNEYGRLYPQGTHDAVAERLEAVWSEPLAPGDAATVERPMTVFPDTWDPPADHETDELPTAKWFQAKGRLGFSSLRRSILRRSGHRRGGSDAPTTTPAWPESHGEKIRPEERRSYEDDVGSRRSGSVAGFSVAETLVSVMAATRPRAKTTAGMLPPKEWQ